MRATDLCREAQAVRPLPGVRRVASVRRRVGSVGALYAHALAIEHEAVSRYRDFARQMSDLGNDAVAALFTRLAEFENEHAFRLSRKTEAMPLPRIAPGEYAWLDSGAPVPEARAFVFRMMTPRHALEIALAAEERARVFFESVQTETSDRGMRALAAEFAREEASHIAWVKDALERLPRPFRPSEDEPGDPAALQQL